MYNCDTKIKGEVIMELTQLNNQSNINQVNDIKNSQKTNNLQNIKEMVEKYPSEKVDITKQNSSGNFLTNVSSNINKIADLQKNLSLISNQLEITTKLVTTTTSVQNSTSMTLDDKQSEIQNLLKEFNKLSDGFERPSISDKEGIYFDGQLGSKPLSVSQILDAVSKQKERLSNFNKELTNEVKSLVSNTKETISSEKTVLETKVEFKNIDYEKESAQFNAFTLESVKGGILPSQANAFPHHSEKLLA